MPVRNPHTFSAAICCTLKLEDEFRFFITFAQSLAKTTPFVTHSEASMITPASNPPRITRCQFTLPITSPPQDLAPIVWQGHSRSKLSVGVEVNLIDAGLSIRSRLGVPYSRP